MNNEKIKVLSVVIALVCQIPIVVLFILLLYPEIILDFAEFITFIF